MSAPRKTLRQVLSRLERLRSKLGPAVQAHDVFRDMTEQSLKRCRARRDELCGRLMHKQYIQGGAK